MSDWCSPSTCGRLQRQQDIPVSVVGVGAVTPWSTVVGPDLKLDINWAFRRSRSLLPDRRPACFPAAGVCVCVCVVFILHRGLLASP